MLSFLVSILGSLFVSFRPSRFHSHSCFTGASLCPLPCVCFFVGIFRLPSTFFRPLQPASDYSASCPFFSRFPDSPGSGFSVHLSSSVQPVAMLSFRFRYSAFCNSVHPRCFASQWLPQRLDLLPCGFRPFPLGFRFRFWLLGFRIAPLSRCVPFVPNSSVRSELRYTITLFSICQQLFSIFSKNFLVSYFTRAPPLSAFAGVGIRRLKNEDVYGRIKSPS